MQKMEFSFNDFPFGSNIIKDLVNQSEKVKPFIHDFFSVAQIQQHIQRKNFEPSQRNLLVQTLQNQNATLTLSDKTTENIGQLKAPTTFTITTGHQLNLFTGPLFSIYKIAQVIAIANELNSLYKNNYFVPVFWMATEDHDFEEINHLHLFNQKFTWTKNAENKICGTIKTDDIQIFLDEIKSFFSNEKDAAKFNAIAINYLNTRNLAEATRFLINQLFGEYGLVIIDGNDKHLKENFSPIVLKELTEQFVFEKVSETNTLLAQQNYHQQVHVREINLFFIDDNQVRHRIVFENNEFKIADKTYSLDAIKKLLADFPEKFSPNALMRPLYQELVLPNLVYVGGGGEIAYWLQLKSTFEKMNLTFPLLRVRDSIFILNPKQLEDLTHASLNLNELNQPIEQILKNNALEKYGSQLDFKVEFEKLTELKNSILEKANNLDKSLNSQVEAEFTKLHQQVEKLQAKFMKAAKTKEESLNNRLTKLKDKLFPENHFQERHENLMNYYFNQEQFIDKIIKTLDASAASQIKILTL